jgi:hypothetical protein
MTDVGSLEATNRFSRAIREDDPQMGKTEPARPPADIDAAVAILHESPIMHALLVQRSPVEGAKRLAMATYPTVPGEPSRPPIAPHAYRGVSLLYLADNLPKSTSADPHHTIVAGDYHLHAQLTKLPNGASALTYYVAYNTQTKRNEFAVGPDSVDAFTSQPGWFRDAGALGYANEGPRSAWELESARAVNSLLREGLGAGLSHFASAWNAAIRDPAWWGRTVTAALTAPVVLETGSPILGRVAARADRIVETGKAQLGMARPLRAAAELQPLTPAERQTATDFLSGAGTPAKYFDDILMGVASGVKVETLGEDLRVVRYSGGSAQPAGRWLTEAPVRDPVSDLALKTQDNTAKFLDTFVIPKGTTVLRSPVAPLNGQPGGATQIFIADSTVLRSTKPASGILVPAVVNGADQR